MNLPNNSSPGNPRLINSTLLVVFFLVGILQGILLLLDANYPFQVISIILNLVGLFFTIPPSIISRIPSLTGLIGKMQFRAGNYVSLVLLLLLIASLVANYLFATHKLFILEPQKPNSTPVFGAGSSPTQTVTVPVTTTAATATSVTTSTPPSSITLNRPGAPFLVDSMMSLNAQDQWDQDNKSYISCNFTSEGYKITSPANAGGGCSTNASTSVFTNFIYEIKMRIVSGIISIHSGAGVIFRYDNQKPSSNYGVSFKQDGTYYMYVFNKGNTGATLGIGHCSSFLQGPNQMNLIDIVAQGSTIKLFVNNTYVMTATDSQFQSGQIGVEMGSDTAPAEVVYSGLKVWKL